MLIGAICLSSWNHTFYARVQSDASAFEGIGNMHRSRRAYMVCACVLLATALFVSATGICLATPDHWADQWLSESQSRDLVKGYPDGSLQPDRSVTRAEFCTILIRLLGEESAALAARRLPSYFSDVDLNYWAKGYLEVAREKGVFEGEDNRRASPDRNITRAEAVTMIDRCRLAMGAPLPSGSGRTFWDESDIPAWAREAVKRLSAGGVVEGDIDGRFHPHRNLSRAEAATLAIRLLDLSGGRWDIAGTVIQVGSGASDLVLDVQGEEIRFSLNPTTVQVFSKNKRVPPVSLRKGQSVGLVFDEGQVSIISVL